LSISCCWQAYVMDSSCRELRFAMWSKRTRKSALTFTIQFHPYFNRNSENTPPNFPCRLWNVVESCGAAKLLKSSLLVGAQEWFYISFKVSLV
jgi:hypothetical protein